MGLRDGAISGVTKFTKGVSYRSGNIGQNLFDASNMINIGGKLQRRWGIARFSSDALPANPQSISFYKDNSSNVKILTKAGTAMYAAGTDGVFSSIKTGLSDTTVHDAVTFNGRHIIALGADGLFSYNGTSFAVLGVTAPSAPTATLAAGGTLTDKTYTVAITYECSSTGFESNIGSSSGSVTTNSGGGNSTVSVSAIPVSTHPLVDLKNIYLKNTTDSGNYLFVAQIPNATTTYSITANPAASSATPPTGKDTPLSGGGKYLAIFNDQVIYTGNSSFQSDVYFLNALEPDGASTANSLITAQGDGPNTGLAVGLFNDSQLNQYIAVFKKRSITIYTEDLNSGNAIQIIINGVGTDSHKTIRVIDGDIFFLSSAGWRAIKNGRLVKKTLADGDVDDIFKDKGFVYEINKTRLSSCFAVYYEEAQSYLTWVAEGSNTSLDKVYNWHKELDQFMPLTIQGNAACSGEDANGNEVIYIARGDRRVYKYSLRNDFHDELVDSTTNGFVLDVDQLDIDTIQDDQTSSIPCYAIINWQPDGDFDASYNFRQFYMQTISESAEETSSIEVKCWINHSRSITNTYDIDFFTEEGFILDVSMLDVDTLGDDRTLVEATADINLTARNILIGIYQDVEDAKLQLLQYQLNYSKNGNRN